MTYASQAIRHALKGVPLHWGLLSGLAQKEFPVGLEPFKENPAR